MVQLSLKSVWGFIVIIRLIPPVGEHVRLNVVARINLAPDARYNRGITFRLKSFLNDGAP